MLLQLSGDEPSIREVDVPEGQTVSVDATLAPLHDQGPSEPGTGVAHPHLLPGIAIGVGAAALIAGSYVSWTAEPGKLDQRHEYYYSGPGIAVAAVGAVAIAGGIYWWIHNSSRKASAPTAALVRGGGIAGWTTSF